MKKLSEINIPENIDWGNAFEKAMAKPYVDNYKEVRHLINKLIDTEDKKEFDELTKQIWEYANKNYDSLRCSSLLIHVTAMLHQRKMQGMVDLLKKHRGK